MPDDSIIKPKSHGVRNICFTQSYIGDQPTFLVMQFTANVTVNAIDGQLMYLIRIISFAISKPLVFSIVLIILVPLKSLS